MSEDKKKKRLLTGWEIILAIISILILLGIALQKMGVDMTYKTEETEIIENPHPGY